MTTPLFISEAPALEIRNIIKSLSPGAKVRWHKVEGYIEFVDDAYLTICISEKPNPPGSKQPLSKCCVLVFNQYWDELELDDSVFQHVKAYHGKTNDHPGNELLPELAAR